MMITEMSWQVSEWLMFLAGCVALYVVITWPAVKGKWWLVVSLSLILLPEALFCLMPYIIGPSVVVEAGRILMGPAEYQKLFMYQMIVGTLFLIGKLLFVVAVFRLRSQFRIFLAHFFADSNAR